MTANFTATEVLASVKEFNARTAPRLAVIRLYWLTPLCELAFELLFAALTKAEAIATIKKQPYF